MVCFAPSIWLDSVFQSCPAVVFLWICSWRINVRLSLLRHYISRHLALMLHPHCCSFLKVLMKPHLTLQNRKFCCFLDQIPIAWSSLWPFLLMWSLNEKSGQIWMRLLFWWHSRHFAIHSFDSVVMRVSIWQNPWTDSLWCLLCPGSYRNYPWSSSLGLNYSVHTSLVVQKSLIPIPHPLVILFEPKGCLASFHPIYSYRSTSAPSLL